MDNLYILISIIALIIITALIFFVKKNKKQKRLSPLAGLSFIFVIVGIIFGDDGMISYGLMAIGIILAIADMFLKSKSKKK